jgi:hypothetical protein
MVKVQVKDKSDGKDKSNGDENGLTANTGQGNGKGKDERRR